MAPEWLFIQFLKGKNETLHFANMVKRNVTTIPIMMSSIHPITASKEASVAEELEGK